MHLVAAQDLEAETPREASPARSIDMLLISSSWVASAVDFISIRIRYLGSFLLTVMKGVFVLTDVLQV